MSSLASLVGATPLRKGDEGADVKVLQIALSAAGYRVEEDGVFGPGTLSALERFQIQHGTAPDGIVGPATAALLDAPHEELVATAVPQATAAGDSNIIFPHDDTASLLAFYGKPWEDSSLLAPIDLPYRMTYDEGGGKVLTVTRVQFHKRAAPALAAVFARLWDAYGHDQAALDASHVTKFSGTYNYRPIRGSSRLSCHAFGAAIDLDAEDNPLGAVHSTLPQNMVDAFKSEGFFWGGDYKGRRDPMHFQAAHE